MDKRKQEILYIIIKEHIKTGAPVGSSIVVEKYKLDISPATVRNEMVSLEDEGFIAQPHTSAGRVPTEKGYNVYLGNLKEKNINDSDKAKLDNWIKDTDEKNLKQAAKELSRLSNNAVFWAFHKNNLFYTGISNLLQQPEFSQINMVYDISVVIDRMDEIINDIFGDVKFVPEILVGSNNPFGNFCSTILTKYKKNGNVGLVGILGPIRMDYEKNIALIKYISSRLGEDSSK
jgi:heat-inducible transcriptional repressor